MELEEFVFESGDGYKLPAYIWKPEGETKSVLQITHGMTEHMGRYESLAKRLSEKGIALAGFDLRGHGKNPGDSKCASFGQGGWDKSLGDMHCFYELLNRRFGDVPHTMLGFSLGSFLLRDYLNIYGDKLYGAIIMGSGEQPALILRLLKKLIFGQCKKYGFDNSSEIVKMLSFEAYNGKFKNTKTGSDWLCSDEKELGEYIGDPLCKEEISAGLFFQMLDSMERCSSIKAYENWNKDLPVLLLSGSCDPVGDMGKGVLKLKKNMEKAGLSAVAFKIINGARHDLIHEIQSGAADEAVSAIEDFILREA